MENAEVVRHVRRTSQKGLTEEQIINELLSVGVSIDQINQAFETIKKERGLDTPPPPLQTKLSTIGILISKTWSFYTDRFGTLIGIQFFALIGILIGVGIMTFGLSMINSSPSLVLLIIGGLILVVASVLGPVWGTLALIYAVKDRHEYIEMKEAFKKAKPKIGPFMWLAFLSGIIISGGMILGLIPGLIFTVGFSLSLSVFVAENLKGMNALLKSREYVRGNFWPVVSRLCIPILVSLVIGFSLGLLEKALPGNITEWVGRIAGIIVQIFLPPFFIAYNFLLYEDIKTLKGTMIFTPKTSTKALYLTVGITGVVLLISLILGSILLPFLILLKLSPPKHTSTPVIELEIKEKATTEVIALSRELL